MNTERTNQGDQGLCQPDGVTGPGHHEHSGGALRGGEGYGEWVDPWGGIIDDHS